MPKLSPRRQKILKNFIIDYNDKHSDDGIILHTMNLDKDIHKNDYNNFVNITTQIENIINNKYNCDINKFIPDNIGIKRYIFKVFLKDDNLYLPGRDLDYHTGGSRRRFRRRNTRRLKRRTRQTRRRFR